MPRLTTWLFVPGAAERFMRKLAEAPARPDVAVLDLEDGVAPSELPEARERVAKALAGSSAHSVPLAVRTHAVSSPAFMDDIGTLGPALFALLLPKVSAPADVREAGDVLSRLGFGHVPIVPLIESAAGLRQAFEILTAHPAVRGVALGGEDLAANLGLPFDVLGGPTAATEGRRAVMDAAGAAIVLAAAAAGVAVRIDTPSLQLADPEAVKAAGARSRATGFTGKFAVHPGQLAPLRAGFLPSQLEVERAEAILTAGTGGGAGRSQGLMVDEAVIRQARRVIEEAEA